jgi:hypothetical protein
VDFPDAVVLSSLDHRLLLGHLRAVLLLGHTDRTDAATVEELLDNRADRWSAAPPAARTSPAWVETACPTLSGTVGDVDVVRDDKDRAVGLHVDADLLTG